MPFYWRLFSTASNFVWISSVLSKWCHFRFSFILGSKANPQGPRSTQNSLPVMILEMKVGPLLTISQNSRHTSRCHCLWLSSRANKLCTNVFKFSCEDLLADSVTDSNHMTELMNYLMMVLMDEFMKFSIFSNGDWSHWMHIILEQTLEQSWNECATQKLLFDLECSPKAWGSTSRVLLADLPGFTQKLMQTHCPNMSAFVTIAK